MSLSHLPVSPLRKPKEFNFATNIVDYWAQKNPSQIALHWVSQNLDVERKLTYRDVSRSSNRIAQLLSDLGLKAGDVLGKTWAEHMLECVDCHFAESSSLVGACYGVFASWDHSMSLHDFAGGQGY